MKTEATKSDDPRNLLVFVHIFKNAGTSVTSQMKSHFGGKRVQHINAGKNDGKVFVNRLRRTLKDPGIKALAGHFSYTRFSTDLARISDIKPIYFTFIRNPFDRLLSSYTYHRSKPDTRHHQIAMENTLEGYIEALLQRKDGKLSNFQCRQVSADGTATFDAALASMTENFAYIGLVEKMEAQNDLARAKLGFAFDASVVVNTAKRSQEIEAMGPAAWDKFKELFSEDIKLYEHVKASITDTSKIDAASTTNSGS